MPSVKIIISLKPFNKVAVAPNTPLSTIAVKTCFSVVVVTIFAMFIVLFNSDPSEFRFPEPSEKTPLATETTPLFDEPSSGVKIAVY